MEVWKYVSFVNWKPVILLSNPVMYGKLLHFPARLRDMTVTDTNRPTQLNHSSDLIIHTINHGAITNTNTITNTIVTIPFRYIKQPQYPAQNLSKAPPSIIFYRP